MSNANPSGVTIDLDLLDNLTIGDIEDVEELSGIGFGAFREGGGVPAKAIRALAFVVRRKDDPTITFEGCRELTMNQLIGILGSGTSPLGKLRANGSLAG